MFDTTPWTAGVALEAAGPVLLLAAAIFSSLAFLVPRLAASFDL